jgi:hypothetical protein
MSSAPPPPPPPPSPPAGPPWATAQRSVAPWTPPPRSQDDALVAEVRAEVAAEHDPREHSRLALILALSIAVVSVLGAIVGWRAEVHAAKASRFEQDAVAASISGAQLRSEAEAEAAKAYSQYSHWVRLGNEANELIPDACSSSERTNLLEIDAGAVCSTQVQFSGYTSAGYVGGQGHFDMEKYARDVQAGNSTRNDIDPEVYQEQAEQQRHHEDNMLYLSLFLVLTLALLTLARIGKSTPSRLILAVPGWACLIGGAVVLISAEF